MSRGARLALGWGIASLGAAGLAFALVLTSGHETQPTLQVTAGELVGLSFTTAGLLGMWRRPANRTGLILMLVGFLYFGGALQESNYSFVSTLGAAVQELFLAAFVHLVLAYPTGVLTRGARRLVFAAYAAAVVFPTAYLVTSASQPGCPRCPPSAFTTVESSVARSVITVAAVVTVLTVMVAAVVLLVRRWRAASTAYRSSFRVVFLSGALSVALIGAQVIITPFLGHLGKAGFTGVAVGVFLTVPFAFTFGLLQGRSGRAAVGRLVTDLGPAPAPGRLRQALRETLGDPQLELGYWLPDLPGYVDIEGRPFDPETHAAATLVDGENGRIGILAHDAALLERPELLAGAASAARLALENERLQAELRAQLAALGRERDFTRLVVNTAPTYFCVVDGDGCIVRFNRTLERDSGIIDDERARGRPFWEVFTSPPEAAAVRGAIGITAATGRSSRHENVLIAADGTRRAVAWVDALIPDEHGQVRYVLLCGLDVTERNWHGDVQSALRRVATLVAVGTDEVELTAVVTSEIGELFDADSANLLQKQGDDSFQIAGGWHRGDALTWEPGTVFPLIGDTASGRATRSLQPERVDSPDDLQDKLASELWRRHGTQTSLAAPIIVDRELWGVISVSRTRDERFPPEAEYRLGDFAALAAQAIANAGAQAEVRASRARLVAAADNERKKLERNLHDGAQQRLVAISIWLRLAQPKLRSAPEDAAELIRNASEQLALALHELRELARGIHPAVLTDRGLVPALNALAERAPVPVTIESELDERLPSAVEAAAYYLVAESLTNVAKYAQAGSVTISLARRDGHAVIEVRDDGIGGADASRGSGLRGLDDRLGALNGELHVESSTGAGTRVWARIPCV